MGQSARPAGKRRLLGTEDARPEAEPGSVLFPTRRWKEPIECWCFHVSRDETIMIGDDIEITVVDIRGDKVRLGITADSNRRTS